MVSIELKGRLGNQLFQYAAGRTIAEDRDFKFCVPPHWEGVDLGLYCELGAFKEQPRAFRENVPFTNSYNPKVNNIKDGSHLCGYWQSEKYFKHNQDAVRKWFYLPPSSPPLDYCVIHLRAQDGYLRENYTLPKEYFARAKKLLSQRYNVKQFVIVTDNPDLAKKLFPVDDIVSSSVQSDFKLLRDAKYKIISNSSFSWWPAWLGLPKSQAVIAPARWINYNYIKKTDGYWPSDIHTEGFIWI